jgi:hypothetical protein
MTIWVRAETKARYEDLATESRRSTSELAQRALDSFRPGKDSGAATETDTEQIRALVRGELASFTAEATATVTDVVTETITARLLELVHAAVSSLVSDSVTATETVTDQAGASVTAMVTDTETDTAVETDTIADTETETASRNGTPVSVPGAPYDAGVAYTRMQALKAEGLSLARIATQLDEEGIGTHHGQPWHKSTVAYLLKTYRR